jgi:predicted TIM-barrel fold metal-dependent hydrolase
MMYPTLASLLEERLADDPEATHAVIHSLNEWIHETWTFNYQDRIFTTPVITPPIVEEAVRELEWCVERGAKAILMRPAPAPGYKGRRSFALPEYDPFWSRVVEHDVLVVLHSSDSGYDRYVNEWSGRDQEMMPFAGDVFPIVSQWRPIEDAVASLVIHGALSRFPELKIAVVENGSSWLRPLMETMENQYKKWPQQFMEHPIDVLRRNIHISPFWEEDLGRVADLLGKDRVLFGSDYPHPEGLAEPRSYVNEVAHLPEPLQRKILRENIARLMGVDLRASIATTA